MNFSALDFVALVSTFGAEPSRWPIDRRDAAEQFAARYDTAQIILDKEARLDALLDKVSAPALSDVLKSRILQAAQSRSRPANDNRPLRRAFMGVAAMFVAGAFGLTAWWSQPASLPSDADIIAEIEIEGLTEAEIAEFAELTDVTESEDMLSDIWDISG